MTKSTIKFTKANLERLKFSGKHKYYYAENFEGLCIYVGKSEKTYHAHWSEPIIDRSTGKVERFRQYLPKSLIIFIFKELIKF